MCMFMCFNNGFCPLYIHNTVYLVLFNNLHKNSFKLTWVGIEHTISILLFNADNLTNPSLSLPDRLTYHSRIAWTWLVKYCQSTLHTKVRQNETNKSQHTKICKVVYVAYWQKVQSQSAVEPQRALQTNYCLKGSPCLDFNL